MQFLKKITIKNIGLDGDKLLKASLAREGQIVPIMRVMGRCSKSEPKLSDYGPYNLFHGAFECMNMLTGEGPFRSGLLIMQGPCEGILAGALALAGETGEIPFVYEIGVEYDPDAITKYVYTGKSIGDDTLQLEDPLAQLRAVAYGDGKVAPKAVTGTKPAVPAKETAGAKA